MADHSEREGLIALKKGTQLIKYSRKGKPRFCPFRISLDETTLIWYSHGGERTLKLSSVSRIIPGQRTAVFKRYLCPEKDYLSFSLLYNNGERSLDLICKDKAEAEVWIASLKALISTGRHRCSKTHGHFDDGRNFIQDGHPSSVKVEVPLSIARSPNANSFVDCFSREPTLNLVSSDVGSDRANMQPRASNAGDGRLSVSSAAPSYSSQGSGPDDCESLGDVYVWGEVWCDASLADGIGNPICSKTDVLLPKPLESNVVLDVHQIACGVRHAALVTRQGEVFTWGDESGGRLGHGIETDRVRPQLVETLAVSNMDYVACGEYHTCAVSVAGDLFSWGDGTYNAGLLGHGTSVSHWIPKRLCGPLEGFQVLSVACGTWHSALATSNGKLFTFGDGTFGVLGHGDRESCWYPREVQSLSGLKTIKVACGVWHTAAIVEVIGQNGGNIGSRKLFTWGDGDKNRLGHGDKKAQLVPTCVSSLIDYNFHQLACGHSITVALTTSGHVFTIGSNIYGQLGNPNSDGKVPCLVQDRLMGELVDEISCGACHVAALTSRNEVFTWGHGANGRLGHGDIEDRKTPTLVEALKDRHVKSISCGSNFTAIICIHKWVSGADQSLCSGCRQAFGFTRKRHNCYNCGLVHCHACSSRKVLKAALAPTPGKPHRVCDACFAKLKASEVGASSAVNSKIVAPRRYIDTRERLERGEIRLSRILLSPNTEPVQYLEVKSIKQGPKTDSLSLLRVPQVPSLLQLKDIAFPSSLSVLQNALKPIVTSVTQPAVSSSSASPYSRRPSPPHSVTPVYSKSIIDSLKKTNELLNQEVLKLHAQVKNLRHKCEFQDVELQKVEKKAKVAASFVAEESSRHSVVKEILKSLAGQLGEMTEKIPPEVYDIHNLSATHTQLEDLLKSSESRTLESSSLAADCSLDKSLLINDRTDHCSDGGGITDLPQNADEDRSSVSDAKEDMPNQKMENDSRSPRVSTVSCGNEGEVQVIEQFEPGVYVTLIQRRNGTRAFKRVKFSKRKFAEKKAEDWWKENKERVYKKYNYRGADTGETGSSMTVGPTEEDDAAAAP
ncbi:PH, RCC1 and FYVE domains-containing protein 1-like isoform X2 [Magnolia sinica]|uniref:PH, RCC1 and FYVE domains-containing protein 1-like isoform X2 n=1 Tax=Magnolia sinica TaxID=86752 RepID=UPI0026591F61|nr:PH, RCC1 and FYVE domains-containing protein 1-like isoform X2 [Magnolia sinica]